MCNKETMNKAPRSLSSIGSSLGFFLVLILGARLIFSFLGTVGITSTIEKDIKKLESKINSKYGKDNVRSMSEQSDWILRFYSAATLLVPKRNFANDVLPFPSNLKANEMEKIESTIKDHSNSLKLLDKAGKRTWAISSGRAATGTNDNESSWYGFVSTHSKGAARYLLNLMNLRTIIASRRGDTALATSSFISALRFSEFPAAQQKLTGEAVVRMNVFITSVYFSKLLMDELDFNDSQLEEISKVYESRNPIKNLGRSLVNECRSSFSHAKEVVNGKGSARDSKKVHWYEGNNLASRSITWFMKPLLALDIRSYLNNLTKMVQIVCDAKNARELGKSMKSLKLPTSSHYSSSFIAFTDILSNAKGAISNKIWYDFSMIRIAAARTKIRTGKFPEGFKDIPEDLLALDNRMDPYTGENYRWKGIGPKFELASFGTRGYDAQAGYQISSEYW